MIIFKYALLRNLRSPASYLSGVLVPIVIIIAMTNTWTYTPAVGLSFLIYMILMSSVLLASLVLEDRIDGSIIKFLISPVSMASYISQNLLAAIIPSITQTILLGILGLLRYNWTVEFTVGVAVTMFVFVLTTAAFAFCWNMFFLSKSGSRYSFLFAAALMMLLSGMIIPIEALPGFLQNVGAIFHLYWFIRAIVVLSDYGMAMQFWLYNIIALFIGVGFLLIGSRRRRM